MSVIDLVNNIHSEKVYMYVVDVGIYMYIELSTGERVTHRQYCFLKGAPHNYVGDNILEHPTA